MSKGRRREGPLDVAPQAGTPYAGLVPNTFEQWKQGIPGLHFPLPDGAADGG